MGDAKSKGNKFELFGTTREMFRTTKDEKPGDASGDVLIIFLPVTLCIDLLALVLYIFVLIYRGIVKLFT